MNARLLVLLSVCSATAGAQVGYPPAESPYRDVNVTSRVTMFGGYYVAAKDIAGVLPQSGPLVGARWDVHIGGPADLAVRAVHVTSRRNVIDPARAQGNRIVETKDISLGFADAGLGFNLTGSKSWHNLMPVVLGSVGVVTDFDKTDIGGFSHGTTFAVGYGFSMRYVPQHSRLSVRVDLGSLYYSLEYPTSYRTIGGDGTAVLPADTQLAQWRNNWTFSAGLTYQLFK